MNLIQWFLTDDSIPEGTGITADDDWKDWEPKTVETQSTSHTTQNHNYSYRSPPSPKEENRET